MPSRMTDPATSPAIDPFCTITACVFDAYGTLFDIASPVQRMGPRLGEKGAELIGLWRRRQLEYSWLRSLMNRYCDFWQITEESLDYALGALKFPADAGLRQDLLDTFLTLDAFPDAVQTLRLLRENGFRTAILSNGTPTMLHAAGDAAGVTPLIDLLLSVESTGCYKPDPSVYRHAVQRLDVPPERVLFVSANGWDVAGATAYGLRTVWINRNGLPIEELGLQPTATLTSLSNLVGLLRLPR
ncbi:haloacid dehalogenase, type II [Elstera cyanobacteriorum]|uniref:(S)-2-haloacid dehalogenase n=2 Tax=Elstera cyanobacteriorum TaxID=2022747 RepID=A0A255Y0P8_9PROT|nr:haloacid dehalogenase, type II [Elstera cyanobacteriorum]